MRQETTRFCTQVIFEETVMKLTTIVVCLCLMCVAHALAEPTPVDMDRLIAALIEHESHGDDKAVGDKHLPAHAYGPLQIRQPCVDDVNKRFGSAYTAKQCLGNRALSIEICKKYMQMYATKERLGREPTYEDCARIWNGGPHGYKRSSTNAYWAQVKKILEKLS